jgi:hypothetical protein
VCNQGANIGLGYREGFAGLLLWIGCRYQLICSALELLHGMLPATAVCIGSMIATTVATALFSVPAFDKRVRRDEGHCGMTFRLDLLGLRPALIMH